MDRPLIYAIDFDGTLCTNAFPLIGEPNEQMLNFVRTRKSMGDYLILWTCREGERLQEAIAWCKAQQLEFDTYNENLPHMNELYGNDSRKVGADYYIDDRAITAWGFGEPDEE